MPERVAALFVETGGCYFGLPDVDPWDVHRDARLYPGPWPVVAHPPCERWGRYARGGPNPNARRWEVGADEGCFAAAIVAVRRWGGVIEHPEASHAWRAFGISRPSQRGGWIPADRYGGFTCCVEQGHYGHRARKLTWLYVVGCATPDLTWGKSDRGHPKARLDAGFHSKEERRRAQKRGTITRLSKRQARATPTGFRDLLLSLARSAWSFGGVDAPQG